MTDILEMGRVLKTDADGFIVSESSLDKLQPAWKEAVFATKDVYLRHLGDVVHSIYVRGTVSRGEAIEGISDVDTLCVVKQDPATLDRSWLRQERQTLAKQFPFTTGVELILVFLDDLLEKESEFDYRFIIKTQSACVYGEDLAAQIAPFRADQETASHFHRNLEEVFQNAKNGIANNNNVEDIKDWCRWVMKRIIRAGFVLVMAREQVFTRDLYPCYALFSKHFPEREPEMKQALYWAINPTSNPAEITAFLEKFGKWLIEERHKRLSNC